ncbi:phosphopantetheine-binding protein [Oceanobacillus sp. CFH 90083]|uniref:phosphopantetheine-binding protein n=1 Tax=Oceanobacillus sp. CFH 90083 TaxID=2592336 RepID=UPI00128DD77E|nr:phosphopantetheine-binding protein [Oceanobacillus sp. CFH 90083]
MVTSNSDFTNCLKEVIKRILELDSNFKISDSLDLKGIGLDSVAIVSLIIELEDMGYTIPDEHLNHKTFENIDNLKKYCFKIENER